MITEISFYLLAIPALLIVGISKGGFGGGLGLVAVPMMSLVISPVTAAAIMLPILCLMDIFALRGFKGRYDRAILLSLLPGSLAGMLIGAFSFHLLTEQSIKLIISVLTLLFCADAMRKAIRRTPVVTKPPNAIRAGFWSFLAGFASFSVHSGGPPLNLYLLPLRLEKSLYVATTIAFFTFINITKIVPYASLGLFTKETLYTALVLAPIAPVGIWLGVWMHHRIEDKVFYRICYAFLFITGIKLGYDAIS